MPAPRTSLAHAVPSSVGVAEVADRALARAIFKHARYSMRESCCAFHKACSCAAVSRYCPTDDSCDGWNPSRPTSLEGPAAGLECAPRVWWLMSVSRCGHARPRFHRSSIGQRRCEGRQISRVKSSASSTRSCTNYSSTQVRRHLAHVQFIWLKWRETRNEPCRYSKHNQSSFCRRHVNDRWVSWVIILSV